MARESVAWAGRTNTARLPSTEAAEQESKLQQYEYSPCVHAPNLWASFFHSQRDLIPHRARESNIRKK
jgi:hypothetical protein